MNWPPVSLSFALIYILHGRTSDAATKGIRDGAAGVTLSWLFREDCANLSTGVGSFDSYKICEQQRLGVGTTDKIREVLVWSTETYIFPGESSVDNWT